MRVITVRSRFIDPSTDSQDGPNNTESYICKEKQLGLFCFLSYLFNTACLGFFLSKKEGGGQSQSLTSHTPQSGI